MSESDNEFDQDNAFRLHDNLLMLNGHIDDALYQSHRYRHLGYDHQKKKSLSYVKKIHQLSGEILERENHD